MKIDLSDPIWGRLPGPFGVRDVAEPLAQLMVAWDAGLARTLLWERLHHQEDLFPVTYAALPWLWEMTRGQATQGRATQGRAEVLQFLSWAVHCALRPEEVGGRLEPGEKYRGLSLDFAQHQSLWRKREQRLTEADMIALRGLQGWFDRHALTIASDAAKAVSGAEVQPSGHLLLGLATLNRGHALAGAILGWLEGWEAEDMPDPALDPPGLALRLAHYARPCPPLAGFLVARAG